MNFQLLSWSTHCRRQPKINPDNFSTTLLLPTVFSAGLSKNCSMTSESLQIRSSTASVQSFYKKWTRWLEYFQKIRCLGSSQKNLELKIDIKIKLHAKKEYLGRKGELFNKHLGQHFSCILTDLIPINHFSIPPGRQCTLLYWLLPPLT